MMYIRLLKAPRLVGNTVTAVVTVTSDLGDAFLLRDTEIFARLYCGTTVSASTSFLWTAGMRTRKVELPAPRLKTNLVLQVSSSPSGRANSLVNFSEDYILAAWSSLKDPDHVVRRLDTGSGCFDISEETRESIARHIWDGGLALAAAISKVFSQQDATLPALKETVRKDNLNVLELGSGCGIVSCSLALLHEGCQLTLTDLPTAQDICHKNLAKAKGTARFIAWDWEDELPSSLDFPYDLVLVSDCFYNPSYSPFLARSLEELGRRCPDMLLVLAHKRRHDSEDVFYDLLNGFSTIDQATMQVGHLEDDEDVSVRLYTMRWIGQQ